MGKSYAGTTNWEAAQNPSPQPADRMTTDRTAAVSEEVEGLTEEVEQLENVHEISAPIVGTSYLAASPDKPAPKVKIVSYPPPNLAATAF